MENLIFSLNATVPVFAMIVLGMFFKKIDIIDDVFASRMNKFVFLIPLPVLLFKDLATLDFKTIWDTKFVLFCFFITILSILIVTLLSFATVYKGNIIKNLIMDCQSYTKYRPNETTGGIFVSWRRKEELPTGA
jgi:predicted permease